MTIGRRFGWRSDDGFDRLWMALLGWRWMTFWITLDDGLDDAGWQFRRLWMAYWMTLDDVLDVAGWRFGWLWLTLDDVGWRFEWCVVEVVVMVVVYINWGWGYWMTGDVLDDILDDWWRRVTLWMTLGDVGWRFEWRFGWRISLNDVLDDGRMTLDDVLDDVGWRFGWLWMTSWVTDDVLNFVGWRWMTVWITLDDVLDDVG